MSTTTEQRPSVRTDIPARMDRLPWSRWHWLVIFALGITWILDGLEVTIVGSIAAVLTKKQTLHLSPTQVGLAGTLYILGAVTGAFLFGHLSDRLGRKRLFMWTLLLYLLATVATAFSWGAAPFFLFRFLTGMGIGGEYSAINSAIDELIPARVRGWADLAINGSWWIGTAVGAALTILLLNPHVLPVDVGWRLSFGLGAILGLCVLAIRRVVPESPRWLMTHNRLDEAEAIVRQIEERVAREAGVDRLPPPKGAIEIRPRDCTPVGEVLRVMFVEHKKRTILGVSLMAGQAFIYNAVFFTFGLVLARFFHVPDHDVGLYILPFALGNFLGPLTLGRLFDTVGRKFMISSTYIVSGALLLVTGWMFEHHVLIHSALALTIAWSVTFFFASSGASAAYLTVSEIFPLEIRATAISFFYAFGTGLSGAVGPVLFGALVQTGRASRVFLGYLIGAVVMAAAGVVEVFLGIPAERRSLEEIARPLSADERAAIEDRAA
jgi:MFS family permease